ncbi:MAG: acyl-CoA dehydrogenase [Alphaproteobacteria bacterium]|nr:acyl-CoA dehydrogenase [Alphaproteobacteria bacterium]
MSGLVVGLRRRLVSAPLLGWYRKVLPAMSSTEREAIEAGTVWWDGDLFSGRPDWEKLRRLARPALSAAEQAFLDGPVDELCRMLDEWKITENGDMPREVWRFIKDKGFFGMIIPKEHGGLGFSALAHSSVVMKISSRSLTAAVTVMVPNSLGPAELLLHYGTAEQKAHYLPRLARGEEIPCFALTGPYAGSDAASLPDRGVVCYGEVDGKRTLGMKVSWNKRYITLGPVATIMGLAFRLTDPDRLLGGEQDLGITLALVPTKTPGVEIGRRHFPANQVFMNGPTQGDGVFMPLDWVIGGRERVGQGWRMLMNCLAAGRSISLPAASTGGAMHAARMTGAYARVRKQFRLPVGKFEGVQEALARIAGNTYLLDAARKITAASLDIGEKPAVLSAIVKYHATERLRATLNDAMDVHGGRGICNGPSNYLAGAYYAVPVSITVEGANILTRSMIIFGQGAIRCHPFLMAEMEAAHDPDRKRGLENFDRALFGHLGHDVRIAGRALLHNLTGGEWASAPDAGIATYYYKQLDRASASFALTAEAALALLGGSLKRRESLSARLGDVLSEMYLMACVLMRFEHDGRPAADEPLVHWCCQSALFAIQQRLDEILVNFPSRPAAWVLRRFVFPFGARRKAPADKLAARCAALLMEPGEARDRLTGGIFISRDPHDVTGRMEHALERVLAAEPVEKKLRDRKIDDPDKALAAGIISSAEAAVLKEAADAVHAAISVDDFAPEAIGKGVEQSTRQKPAVVLSM